MERNILQEPLEERLAPRLGPLYQCSEWKNGVRIRTPFTFPCGQIIDVFCKINLYHATITDYGDTLGWGLSPRGRGKPTDEAGLAQSSRSIPAWAGETMLQSNRFAAGAVYPRVGGGNRHICGFGYQQVGLSPRGRGKLSAVVGSGGSRRSIPAWAGETRSRR